MPLTGSGAALASALAPVIKAKLLADPRTKATDDAALPEEKKSLTPFCQAVAEAVAEVLLPHIVANAVVTMPIASIQVAGTAAAQANPAPCLGALT